jgi:hypothetical protein
MFPEPIDDNDLMRCPGFIYDEQAPSIYPSLKAAQRRLRLTKEMKNFVLTFVGEGYFEASCRVPKDESTWTPPLSDKPSWGFQKKGNSYVPFEDDFEAPNVSFIRQISQHVFDVEVKVIETNKCDMKPHFLFQTCSNRNAKIGRRWCCDSTFGERKKLEKGSQSSTNSSSRRVRNCLGSWKHFAMLTSNLALNHWPLFLCPRQKCLARMNELAPSSEK